MPSQVSHAICDVQFSPTQITFNAGVRRAVYLLPNTVVWGYRSHVFKAEIAPQASANSSLQITAHLFRQHFHLQ